MSKTTESSNQKPKVSRLKDHDIFMRGIFSYTEFVLKILHYAVPNDLKPFIDFGSLQILSDAHIDNYLRLTNSDTIYVAKLNVEALSEEARNDSKRSEFRFCFLGEFKSDRPKEPIDFQVDDYTKSIQRLDIKNDKTPSIVVPLLIYHGDAKWEHKRLYDVFAKYLPEEVLAYVSFPKYIVIDLQAMENKDIEAAIGLGPLRGAFIALKHAQDKAYFKEHLGEILKFVEESPTTLLYKSYLKMLLEYSQRRSGLESKEFNQIVEQLNPDLEMVGSVKTIFEEAEEKGMEKGMEKGIAIGEARGEAIGEARGEAIGEARGEQKVQNILRRTVLLLFRTTGLSDAEIAVEVDAPISFVESLRREFKEETKS